MSNKRKHLLISNLVNNISLLTKKVNSIKPAQEIVKKYDQLLSEIEELIQIQPIKEYYNYWYFIAEIRSFVLGQYRKSIQIYQKLKKDSSKQIVVGSILRKSFIHTLQQDYQSAYKQIQKIQSVNFQQSNIKMVIYQYLQTIRNAKKDKNVFYANQLIDYGQIDQAIKYYIQQYQTKQHKDKLYAAKMIQFYENKCTYSRQIGNILETIHSYLDNCIEEEDKDKVKIQVQNKKRYIKMVANYRNRSKIKISQNQERNFAIKKIQNILRSNHNFANQQTKKLLMLKTNLSDNSYLINRQALLKFIKQVPIQDQDILNDDQRIGENYSRKLSKVQQNYNNPFTGQQYQSKSINRDSYNFNLQKDDNNYQMKKSQSVIIDAPLKSTKKSFKGSNLIKIHTTSQGTQQRYFYIKKSDIDKKKLKLYHTKEKQKSSGDDYYDLKKINKITQGKVTKALQRSQCARFQQSQCFTVYTKDLQRNFYAPNLDDYFQWINFYKSFIENNFETSKTPQKSKKQIQNLEYSQTKPIKSKYQSSYKNNMSSSKLKKSAVFF